MASALIAGLKELQKHKQRKLEQKHQGFLSLREARGEQAWGQGLRKKAKRIWKETRTTKQILGKSQ